MRRLFARLLLAATLIAGPALAATGLEAARSNAEATRSKVNGIRAQQMTLRTELNQVARRIEALKAQQKGALLKGGELDASLRRSQELSGLLTSAAQELAGAETALEQDNLALLTELTSELDRLRASWPRASDRQQRAEILRRMRALRAEREQVRAMLPAARVPALDMRDSDDAEDLLEQADALRDSEDKVRQQMRALQARIVELRREQELDRRMSDFLAEEDLFDEQDRRLRRGGSAARQGGGVLAPAESADSAPTFGASSTEQSKTSTPAPSPSLGRVESRPIVGAGAAPLDELDPRLVPALEARLRELEKIARELDQRADAAESRAQGAK